MILRTSRLLLRRAHPDDLYELHGIMSQMKVMRYWSPPHTRLKQTRDWLHATATAAPETSDDFIIEKDGRVIGKAGAWRLPEVGFLLDPEHWKQGLATEAMLAVMAYLFATHDLEQLTADVDPRNAASIRLLTRLGFRETGRAERTMQWGDEWCDSVYFAAARPA